MRADGRVDPVGMPGMLLGIDLRPPIPDVEAGLAPGDAMLLYTDGVTEAGPRSAMLGEAGLMRALAAGAADRGPERLVERVEALAVGAQAGEPRDDIALLAIAAGAVLAGQADLLSTGRKPEQSTRIQPMRPSRAAR